MGHAVYITRGGGGWSFEDREQHPITLAEWQQYVAGDAEFVPFGRRLAEGLATWPDGRTEYVEHEEWRPDFWEWTGRPADELDEAFFQYLRGGLIVRRPSAATLAKACAVAATLGARVIGDDDRVYGPL